MDVPCARTSGRTQIDDILESFAAWAEITDGNRGYEDAGQRLGRALNARKATRDFQPCRPLTGPGLPKSSLDGARETVLPDWPAEERARVKLRLSPPGEQLDTLGVIKRLAGDAEQFTALPRIAADSWIEQLTPASSNGCGRRTSPWSIQVTQPMFGAIPAPTPRCRSTGIFCIAPRLESALAQEREQHAIEALKAFRRSSITEISREQTDTGRQAGTPVPYAAVLKADGDRMGQLLSRARSAQASRDISRALQGFASSVRGIVRAHRGHAIYAGGDDVLALLSLERARNCASALALAFWEHLSGIAERMELDDDERPTLSVGVGIGYVIEPLGALRALADRAEQQAKGDAALSPRNRRNALAILLRIRSGAELHWRAQWTDKQAFEALDRFADAYRRGELPTRAAYDLRDIGRRLARLPDSGDETARGMRNAEVDRLLDRARRGGGSEAIPGELRTLIRESGRHRRYGRRPTAGRTGRRPDHRALALGPHGQRPGRVIMSPSNRKKKGKQKRPPFRYRKKARNEHATGNESAAVGKLRRRGGPFRRRPCLVNRPDPGRAGS